MAEEKKPAAKKPAAAKAPAAKKPAASKAEPAKKAPSAKASPTAAAAKKTSGAAKAPAAKKPAAAKSTSATAAKKPAATKAEPAKKAPAATKAPAKATAPKKAATATTKAATPKKAATATTKAAAPAQAETASEAPTKAPAKKAPVAKKPATKDVARPQVVKLHHLRPAPGSKKARTRVGRGEGSKGKTAGRGTKGTKARYQVRPGFEGGQLTSVMRAPKLRGFTNPFRVEYQVVNVGRIAELYPKGGSVTVADLVAKGAVRKNEKVKVLADGDISVAVTIDVDRVSNAAKQKIEKAGGQVATQA
jgi:large subunit ribosomal protein L15